MTGARNRFRGVTRALAFLACAASVFLAPAFPAGEAPAGRPVRRLGVVSLYNPRLMYLKLQPLADWLAAATGERWELALATSYEQAVEELCSGGIDLSYLGPFTYVIAHARCGGEPLVHLRTGGKDTFESWILVRADSGIRDLAGLRGHRVAFGSPLSTSSYLVPRRMLERAGLRLGAEVSCRFYGHHERAARAVLLGEADAAGVRDTIGARFVGRGLRLLARSAPIPNFPFVVPRDTPEGLRRRWREVLVELPRRDEAARAAMAGWDVELRDGFAPATDRFYDPVRRVIREVFGPVDLREALPLPPCEQRRP